MSPSEYISTGLSALEETNNLLFSVPTLPAALITMPCA